MTNFTTNNLELSKPNLIEWKKARIASGICQEQILQGKFVLSSQFWGTEYHMLIGASLEVAKIVEDIWNDDIGTHANNELWGNDEYSDTDGILNMSDSLTYEELSEVVSTMCPKTLSVLT